MIRQDVRPSDGKARTDRRRLLESSGVLAGAPVRSLEIRRALFWRSDRPHSRAVAAFIDEIGKAVVALRAARPAPVREPA